MCVKKTAPPKNTEKSRTVQSASALIRAGWNRRIEGGTPVQQAPDRKDGQLMQILKHIVCQDHVLKKPCPSFPQKKIEESWKSMCISLENREKLDYIITIIVTDPGFLPWSMPFRQPDIYAKNVKTVKADYVLCKKKKRNIRPKRSRRG